jgi:hypothetical protein
LFRLQEKNITILYTLQVFFEKSFETKKAMIPHGLKWAIIATLD